MAKRAKNTGKRTRKPTPYRQVKWSVRRVWRWFAALSWKQKVLLVAAPVLAALIIIPLATYAYFSRDIGNQERLMNRNNTGVVLTDIHGEAFYSFGRAEHREALKLDQISDYTEKALIDSEDKDFYEHGGFSVISIMGALYANLATGSTNAYGGSTITQQLAKNTLLTESRTFLRKYQELAISIAIEREYTKDQILEMYLNSVYYGEGAFGIKDAAETYFGKQPGELTLGESAMLIGVLPAPSAYSPISGDPDLARERQNTVLSRMVKNGTITEAEKATALEEQLVYVGKDTSSGIAPHFAEMVMAELYEKYGEETVNRSGYQVKTSLDLTLQRAAVESINSRIGYINGRGGSNASVVAIDPTTGQIRALVGSADWNNTEFGKVNMATSKRQPGSSFKPVYYAEALARGVITPATIYADEPTDFNGYQPLNADRKFRGNISVRRALAQSLNIPSVKVLQELGINTAVEAAKRMGVTTLAGNADYGLSFALGSAEVPLTEMTNIYAAFANQGMQYDPTVITEIKNKFSRPIFSANPRGERVISEEGAYLISDVLADNNARAPIFGSSLTISGRQVAVKTGTTDNQRDAWTIGYTPQLAVGVWVGNNDNQAMISGGSDMAGPIWRGVMQAGLQNLEAMTFTRPGGVVELLVCYANGQRANRAGDGVYKEYFLESAQPTGTCNVPDPAEEARKKEAEEEAKRKQEEAEKQAEEEAQKAAEEAEEEAESDETTPTTPDTTTPSVPSVTP